jgi:hypothetical protein
VAGDEEYEQSHVIDFVPERQRRAAPGLLSTLKTVAELRRKWRSQNEDETIDSLEYMDGLDDLELDAVITEAESADILPRPTKEVLNQLQAAIAKATADSPASERSGIDINALLAKRQQIASIWSIEDVQQNRPDLSDDDAWEVLQTVKHDHDCNYGITWQTLEMAARHLFPEPPAAEAAPEA